MSELKRVVLKEEMVALTGSAPKAIILNQLIYWTNILNKADQEIQKEVEESKKLGMHKQAEKKEKQLRNGWFYKSGDELAEELMGISSAKTINRLMNEMVKENFILKGRNPDPKKKWDRTNWYKVDIDYVRFELKKLNYALEGYAIPEGEAAEEKPPETPTPRISQNEISISQNEISISQNEKSISHSEKTIPEITTEISSETSPDTTSNNLSIKKVDESDLPSHLKEYLKKQLDRLIDLNISISEIEQNYLVHKNNEHVYVGALDYALKNDTIHDLAQVMSANIKNQLNYLGNAPRKPKQTGEVIPSWFPKSYTQQAKVEVAEEVDMSELQKKINAITSSKQTSIKN